MTAVACLRVMVDADRTGLSPAALGPLVAALPLRVVDAALVLSPISASASAARMDIFHGPLLYAISPLAHMTVDAPAWPTAAAAYLVMAAACVALAGLNFTRAGRATPAERMTI